MKLEKMRNLEIIILTEKVLEDRLQSKYGIYFALYFDENNPSNILISIGKNDIERLFAEVIVAKNTYFSIRLIEDDEIIVIDKRNMYRNKLVDLLPNPKDREELYNAIYDNRRVRYTRHNRGIPAKSFIVETPNYYEFIIEPNEELISYTDFELGTINTLLLKAYDNNVIDVIKDLRYSKKQLKEDFDKSYKDIVNHYEEMTNYQYSPSDIIKFVQRFDLNKLVSKIPRDI